MLAALLPLLLSTLDSRNIRTGSVIPAEGYADQPYVVLTRDKQWLCVLTTGRGIEGESGQHVIALRSKDHGKTWSPPVDIEPAAGPESSWAVPLITPSGRIYVIYTFNKPNIRQVPDAGSPAIARRVDTLGVFAFRYSDDHGLTWSADRYEIPQRPLPTDAENNFQGREIFFWSVAKPLIDRGQVFIGFARISRWGQPGTLVRSRGFLLRSDNILTEPAASKIRWQMLPESDDGLTAPKGPIAEETNVTALSDGTLYAVYRTIDGYLAHAYSTNRGRTWSKPAYATYADGRPIKNPRACPVVRRFSNGKYLLWFHNNGGEAVHLIPNWNYYQDRNPGWVSGGVERAGRILWSPPEILLYDDDPVTRISYPDFVEDNGQFFITETQKSIARVHEIDPVVLDRVWGRTSTRPGVTIEFKLRLKELSSGQTILEAPDFRLATGDRFNLKLSLGGLVAESDPGLHPGTLKVNTWHHVAINIDPGPGIVSFVIDGVRNDGGPIRQFGWTRLAGPLPPIPDLSLRPLPYGETKDLAVTHGASTAAPRSLE